MRSRLANITICLTWAAAALWLLPIPVSAHPTVDVANPQPNDHVIAGSLVMEGVAYDHDSTDGPGIARVSVRMCGPGGQHLGEAELGLPSRVSLENGDARYANAGWRTTVQLPGAGDLRELCVTAYSAVTNREALVRIPITIGWKPSAPPQVLEQVPPEEPTPTAITVPATATPVPSADATVAPATPTPMPIATPTPEPEE